MVSGRKVFYQKKKINFLTGMVFSGRIFVETVEKYDKESLL